MQLSLTGTMAKSLRAQIYYTWSKYLDTFSNSNPSAAANGSSYQVNPYDPNYDWGLSSFDVRHSLSGNILYELPFKQNAFVKGWQLSLIPSVHSGPPYNVNVGYDNVGDSVGSTRPNLIGNPDIGGTVAANPGCVAPAVVHTPQHWFNPCAFGKPLNGHFGNLARNSLTGPGVRQFRHGAAKNHYRATNLGEVPGPVPGRDVQPFHHANFKLPNLNVFSSANPKKSFRLGGDHYRHRQ